MIPFSQSYSQMFSVEKLNSAMNFRVMFLNTTCFKSVILGARPQMQGLFRPTTLCWTSM